MLQFKNHSMYRNYISSDMLYGHHFKEIHIHCPNSSIRLRIYADMTHWECWTLHGKLLKSLRVLIGIWNLHYALNFWETYQHESSALNYQLKSAVPIQQQNTVGVQWRKCNSRLQVPIMKYDHGASWIDCSPMILINPSELVILLFQLLSPDNSCWLGWFLSGLQK